MTDTPSGTKRLSINAISSFVTVVLQLTLLVWVNQYLVKRIEPQEYALLPLVTSLLVFASLFQRVFAGGISRYIVEADARGQHEEVTRITSSMLPILIAAAAGFAIIGGMGAFWIETLLKIPETYIAEARTMLALLLAPLILNVACAPYTVGLYVKQNFVWQNAIDLAGEALRVLIVVGLLVGVSTTVMWLVVGSSTAYVFRLLVRIVATRKLLPEVRYEHRRFSASTARTLIGYGSWVSIGGLTTLILDTVPVLLLGHFSSAIDVAAFHLGRLPDLSIRRIVVATVLPAQPMLTALYATGEQERLRALYYRGGRYHMWAALVLVGPLVVFGREIVVLYAGARYQDAAFVFGSLLAIYPVIWASAMFYRLSTATGRVRQYYICEIAILIAILASVSLTVGVWGYGAAGAAASIGLASMALHIGLVWPLGLRMVEGSWRRFFLQTVVPGITPLVAAAIACAVYRGMVDLSNWLVIAGGAAVSSVVYVITVVAFFDSADRALLRRTLSVGANSGPRAPRVDAA